MALLELRDLGRRIGDAAAVEGLSLSVEEGELFAVLGPPGCGKTTLLRLLAGFERPDRGSIVLDGIDITELPARYRPINLMFQSQALFPHMSVAANVAYGLEMEGLRRREIRRRVAEILETLDIRDCARRRPHHLAVEERQRVALARALVKRPRLLLLDEPLTPLDRRLRQSMHLELKRLQQEFALTVLLVTQDAEAALATSDTLAVMYRGRILQQGKPHQLYERPESRAAAEMLGAVNLLEGYAAEGGVRVPHLGLLKGEAVKPVPPGEPAILAVRPERVLLSAGALAAANAFTARLEDLTYLGQDVLLHFRLDFIDRPLVARATAAGFEALGLEDGQYMTLGFETRHGRILPLR
ncbi:MAG TPA: ABC transporter ATP-binding protein [Kiloniellales bacterium]|nr:ABC transporter ATP-binding protein [Kiloniellales bacterium]